MALFNNPVPSPVGLLPTVEAWLADANARFAANRYGEIDDADFRAVFAGMAQVFADWRHLSVKRVKGATYPVPYTDNLNLVPADYRILGMQAVAINGVDSTTGGAGITAPPIFYTLLRDSSGDVAALLDVEPATALTVKAHWVRTSGTAAEKMASFPVLQLEDHNYAAGDVVQYTFASGETRLLEFRTDRTEFQHPTPTGLDSDPVYKPFAPLTASSGYDDTAVLARLANHDSQLATIAEQLTPPLTSERFDGVVDLTRTNLFNAAQILGNTGGGTVLVNRPYTSGQGWVPGTVIVDAGRHVLNLADYGHHLFGGGQIINNFVHVGRLVLRAGTATSLFQGGRLIGGIDATSADVANATIVLDNVKVYPATPGAAGSAGAVHIILRNGAAFVNCEPGNGAVVTTEASGAADTGPWPPLTSPVTDDTNKFFRGIAPANFRTESIEYSTDSGATYAIAAEAMRSGDVISVPVSGNKPIGAVRLRVRAGDGRPASAEISNGTAFTALLVNLVWQANNAGLTYSAGWSDTTVGGAYYGSAYKSTTVSTLGRTVTWTVPAGYVAVSIQGHKDSGGSYFTLSRNGTVVVSTDQFIAGTGTLGEYLPARIAVSAGDVLVFTTTNETYTTVGGSPNVNNYFNQVTHHAS